MPASPFIIWVSLQLLNFRFHASEPNYWALNPARFLIKTSPDLLSACLTAKMSSPLQTCTLHLRLPLSFTSVLLLALFQSWPSNLWKNAPPSKAALSNLSPKEVIKKPAVDPFPSLSPNPPVPREAQSPGMQRMDTCAQYRAELGLYSVTERFNKTFSTPFINIY